MHVRLENYVYQNKPIGIGSFAKVYEGIDVITKKKVAIKKINKGKLNKALRERLNMEIKLMKTYHNHKNIIDLYDVLYSESEKHVFIILEYCDCGDLGDFIKNNRLGEERILYYMTQLRDGLKYLLKNNVIHRDLKPKNILLTNNYKTLKIADFGFATTTLDEISLMDTLCGSPLYMAPEMMTNKKYNIQSDLWSIGVILYEMIYRQHPYGEPMNILDLMDRLKNRVIEFPESDMSDECLNLLQTLLKTNVGGRINWEEFFNHTWFDIKGLCYSPVNKIGKTKPIPIKSNKNDLMFSMDMDESINNLNSSVKISKSDYRLEDILYEDHLINQSKNKPQNHIRKDGILIDFEIIDKSENLCIGSMPTEQRVRSYSGRGSILKNSLAYLSTSLQILKKPTSKLFNFVN